MSEKGVLVLVFAAVVACWVIFGGGAVFLAGVTAGGADDWSPRNYVPAKEGDCIVYPQGDPLYDEHYANNVNIPNCEAEIMQAQADNIDAQTKKIETDTTTGVVGVYSVFSVLAALLLLFLFYVLKGG